jgi:hypothetical protein
MPAGGRLRDQIHASVSVHIGDRERGELLCGRKCRAARKVAAPIPEENEDAIGDWDRDIRVPVAIQIANR